ncbi:hypothetical protein HCU40_25515 [Pseudanabaena biceps]|jgi:molybdopterin converting factor small subunit|nr:hypothetical protein [Pseudanabaena biceps]
MSAEVQTGVAGTIVVEFMGRPSEIFGQRREVEVPDDGLELGALRRQLAESLDDEGGAVLADPFIRGGVGDAVVLDSTWVRPGQAVFFFSPYSGG